MLTADWTEAGDGEHQLYRVAVTSSAPAPEGGPAVTAYAVKRPDGHWAILAVNRDGTRPARLSLRLKGAALKGPVEVVQYSQANYTWKPDGYAGHPIRNLPPFRSTRPNAGAPIALPPYSLTVIRER